VQSIVGHVVRCPSAIQSEKEEIVRDDANFQLGEEMENARVLRSGGLAPG
jgi:hypothetical protein